MSGRNLAERRQDFRDHFTMYKWMKIAMVRTVERASSGESEFSWASIPLIFWKKQHTYVTR